MEKFENQVQELKFKVLKSIAVAAYENTDLYTVLRDVPKQIVPGPKATMRCCIYKERAVVEERISLGLGGHNRSKNILEVIDIACDECPLGGYEVSNHCRGCIARHCLKACPRGAIGFDTALHKSFINKDLCVNCGLCSKACAYNAIINYVRPCESVCPTHAISKGDEGQAFIDNEKCVGCGHCVNKCPFGAIVDKSYVLNVINLIKNKDKHVYAIVAPSVCASFRDGNINQILNAIKKLGFYDVVETAYGADLVAKKETEELIEKGKITSSCCPSLVAYIKKELPEYACYISSCHSPMVELALDIKNNDPLADVIFIGPCTSKKYEVLRKSTKGCVSFALTFEELQAMLAARDIDISKQDSDYQPICSSYGRGFASSGGVSLAIEKYLKEINSSFIVKPMVVSGIKDFKRNLKTFFESDDYNFFEGMSCEGGCVNGPCALHHDLANKVFLNKSINGCNKKEVK